MIQSLATFAATVANVLMFWKSERFKGELWVDSASRRTAELGEGWQVDGVKGFIQVLLINRNFGKKN